jgi:lipoyl-dependent peroxiredoxin
MGQPFAVAIGVAAKKAHPYGLTYILSRSYYFAGDVCPRTNHQEIHAMPVRTSEALWEGDLKRGKGTVKLGQGAYNGPYSFQSRFENGAGTNPEELIAAAHAGCFSMALSAELTKAGFTPTSVHTVARVHLEKQGEGFGIPKIELITEAKVPGIDPAAFDQQAQSAKKNCPVSKLLAAAEITLDAKLLR